VFLPSDTVAAAALPGAATAALDAYAFPPHLTPALRNALATAGAATGMASPTDTARHVVECQLTHGARVQNAMFPSRATQSLQFTSLDAYELRTGGTGAKAEA